MAVKSAILTKAARARAAREIEEQGPHTCVLEVHEAPEAAIRRVDEHVVEEGIAVEEPTRKPRLGDCRAQRCELSGVER
jgi:hypothetical protein